MSEVYARPIRVRGEHPCGDPTCTEDHGEEWTMDAETYHLLTLIGVIIIIVLLIVPLVRRR